MNNKQAEKKFPSYFKKFEIPEWAREQELEVAQQEKLIENRL